MVKHPLSGGDRAQNHESGSVRRKKMQTSSIDSSHDAGSSGDDESLSGSISLARERCVGNDFRALIFARDRDRDRTAVRCDVRSTLADGCDPVASTDKVRSTICSRFPSRVRGLKQPIRAPSGARDLYRNSGRSAGVC